MTRNPDVSNRIATTPARPPAEKPLEPDAVRQAETSDDIISRGWKVQVGIEFVDRSARKPPEDDLPHHLMIAVVIIEHYARNKCWAFPSTITLAKKYGCTPRTMKRVLRALIDRDWIVRVPIIPGKRRGMITILRKRIDREDLPVFDPAHPDEYSEDDIRQAVWRRKGIVTDPSCSKQCESADSEPQMHSPQSYARQFPEQTRGHGRPPNKGTSASPRRMTNSSEKPLNTTTTEKTPKSSSSFSNSPPKNPKPRDVTVDQAVVDALVERTHSVVPEWDLTEARRRVQGWLSRGKEPHRIGYGLDRTEAAANARRTQ